MSPEHSVLRSFLETIASLPWSVSTEDNLNINHVKAILDEDHYDLEKPKDRILEYIAILNLVGEIKGQILCLVGPPGVGKTSLARSIARALGRKFVRISLGGVRDEAEIRGHRRTYIGSMPGKIIQSMKKAGTVNPVILLDEVDKMSNDFRGDPAAALLEVLDPEQNSAFNDHYLEVDYDLSDVMFICTANSLNMPQPLLDRMEIIRLSGYTEDEKLEIAERHLLPKQMKQAGLKKNEFAVSDEAMRDLIRYYTREAGVRSLEREVARLCRKAIKDIVMNKRKTLRITPANLGKFAGIRKYHFGEVDTHDRRGVVNGLAYTEFGGDLLSIEALKLPGKGRMKTTGKLGDASKYANLSWSSVAGAYNTTGGATTVWNGKSHNDDYLTLGLDYGHPGRPGYYTIVGYTIQSDDGAGTYRLNSGSISKADGVKTGDEDGLELLVYVNNIRMGGIESVLTDEIGRAHV